VDGRHKPGHDEVLRSRSRLFRCDTSLEKFFIIFVDGIFTTLFERPFTNTFDASARNAAIACVYRAGNAD
jgi:hypothetical protein